MRIVLATFGTLGDVHPLIALALELKRRGHFPVLAVPELFRRRIEPLGLPFHSVRPSLDPSDRAMVEMLMDIKKGTERTLRDVLFPAIRESYLDLLAAVKESNADLLLTGELSYAGPLVAEVTGILWASYVLAPLSFFSGYDPPALPPFPRMARVQEKVPGMGHLVVRFARNHTRNWAEPVYKLRRELGLPEATDPIYDAKHSPGLVLAMFSPLLGSSQPDWPSCTLTTGFVFYDGNPETNSFSSELEEFLEAGRPPLVFTLGSAAVFAAADFFEISASVAERLGVRAVLLTGTDKNNVPRRKLPESICVVEYAAYSKLFPRAAAIVHQGGVGTLAHVLHAGKPMLVMPYSHDQPDNARRLLRLGVARILRRRKYGVDAATRQLQILLSRPDYAQRAAAIAAQLKSEEGLKVACDALEKMNRVGVEKSAGGSKKNRGRASPPFSFANGVKKKNSAYAIRVSRILRAKALSVYPCTSRVASSRNHEVSIGNFAGLLSRVGAKPFRAGFKPKRFKPG